MKTRWFGLFIGFIAAIFMFPILIILCASFMTVDELSVVLKEGTPLRLIPYEATLSGYTALLFGTQTYLATFWNSMFISLCITLFQAAVSLIAAFLLAKARNRFSRMLLFAYIVSALMPFQVTLLPNYILAKQLGLYNTWWTLILPGAFAPYGVFLLHQFIKKLPDGILEAAMLETSSLPHILCRIIAPIVKPGLISVMILAFAESWNMVEQPLVLIKDEWLYPLSLALNGLKSTGIEILFPGAVLLMIPTVLLFFLFEDELVSALGSIRL